MNNKAVIKARIKCSGVVLSVEKICDNGRVQLEGGLTLDAEEVELLDSFDYEPYRAQFAGMAMQAMWTGIIQSPMLMEQMARRAVNEGFKNVSELIASDSVAHADNLIAALKKPRQIQTPGKDSSNEIGDNEV